MTRTFYATYNYAFIRNLVFYKRVVKVLKNHVISFGSFLDIRENAEWPQFFGLSCKASKIFGL